MNPKWLTPASLGAACVLAILAGAAPTRVGAQTADAGRFVWHDLLTKDVAVAKRFYGELFGWSFEDTKRDGRPYTIARLGDSPVAGLVDVSGIADAGAQWLSFVAVADMSKTIALVQSDGGKVLVQPKNLPLARAAVVTDPQGAPLGLAQLRGAVPDPVLAPGRFFWQEYLARDVPRALDFYKKLAGYEPAVTDSRLGVEYHVLRKTRDGAGLFQLPDTVSDVLPNWLPYVLVDNAEDASSRATALGGRILVSAAPERRNRSLAVIADPGGAALALQKYPF